jgi:hypothetical protein
MLTLRDSMTLSQRLLFHQKSKISAHLPHPDIHVERVENFVSTRTKANEALTIDGNKIRDWISISVSIQPDYWHTVV